MLIIEKWLKKTNLKKKKVSITRLTIVFEHFYTNTLQAVVRALIPDFKAAILRKIIIWNSRTQLEIITIISYRAADKQLSGSSRRLSPNVSGNEII